MPVATASSTVSRPSEAPALKATATATASDDVPRATINGAVAARAIRGTYVPEPAPTPQFWMHAMSNDQPNERIWSVSGI
jgi:hypothetical protein